jgi:hypothetical protein
MKCRLSILFLLVGLMTQAQVIPITNTPSKAQSGTVRMYKDKVTGNFKVVDASNTKTEMMPFRFVTTAPTTSTSTCAKGDFYTGAGGQYLCVAANTWVKLATASFEGEQNLTLVTEPSVYESLNSGLNLANIPDFSMKSDWLMVYDMLRAYETRTSTLELSKGFRQISHNRLGSDGIYSSTPFNNRIGFLNTQNDADTFFDGDPFVGSNIDLDVSGNTSKWISVASVLGTDPGGTNGLVYDIERWDWAGDGTYQERIADVHTLIFKTAHNFTGNNVNSTKKPLICWGPYAPIELPSADAIYDNLAGGVNVAFTTRDRNDEFWHDYATHYLVGMYYRSDDAADGFKEKMYKNILCFDANALYNSAKKKVAMVYLHEENNNTVLLPEYVAEFQAIMPAMSGANGGYYAWAEAGHATIGDGKNWNTYKKFLLGLYRLSRINTIFQGTNLVYKHWESEFSVNGGTTYIKPKPIYSYTNSLPIVRVVTSDNGFAIAACNPFAADATVTALKVKVNGTVYDITCNGKKTSLYYKLAD